MIDTLNNYVLIKGNLSLGKKKHNHAGGHVIKRLDSNLTYALCN